MPLKIVKDDIRKIKCDAIVVFCDGNFAPLDKIGREIHKAAGSELAEFCKKLGSAKAGEARVTPAFNLDCEYVIHAVAPGQKSANAERELRSAYLESLKLSRECQCARVAIALSSASANYPSDKMLRVARDVIVDFLADHEMTVSLASADKAVCKIDKRLQSDIQSFITNNYSTKSAASPIDKERREDFARYSRKQDDEAGNVVWGKNYSMAQAGLGADYSANQSIADIGMLLDSSRLDNMLKNMDKGFRDTLFYYIDKKGLSDVECYKRSNVDKKTFSKIKCNADYRPSKVTAVSFAVGLHLDMIETEHLLSTAGMCLSHSSKFDVIIEYFITSGTYETIFDVNEVLYQFDQSLLGV